MGRDSRDDMCGVGFWWVLLVVVCVFGFGDEIEYDVLVVFECSDV